MIASQALKCLAPVLLLLTLGAEQAGPHYTAAGELIPPPDYREWIFLSAGLDMSYSDNPAIRDHHTFNNVFVDPRSWHVFQETGHWPDKTMMVLEIRGAGSKASINKNGQFQTEEVTGEEIHLRDEARFKGGWGFFRVQGGGPAKMIPYQADCYSCHLAHGAVDTTFTQFYPTARPVAVKAGTYAEH
jgi:hypothetical protein